MCPVRGHVPRSRRAARDVRRLRGAVGSPDYPWAPRRDDREAYIERLQREWGGVIDIDTLAPSRAHDPALRDWWARYLRSSASPSAVAALTRMNTQVDVRAILPTITVPTLIIHRRDDRDADVGGARHMAQLIPRRPVRRTCRGRSHDLGGP